MADTLRRDMNRLAALGMVARQPMHGYLVRGLARRMGLEHWARLSASSIYATLARLPEEGLATVNRERSGKAPERNVYRITSQGRKALKDLLRSALGGSPHAPGLFHLALAFCENLEQGEVVQLLKRRLDHLSAAAKKMGRQKSALQHYHPEFNHLALLMDSGRDHLRAEMRLCRRVIELLEGDRRYFERFKEALADADEMLH